MAVYTVSMATHRAMSGTDPKDSYCTSKEPHALEFVECVRLSVMLLINMTGKLPPRPSGTSLRPIVWRFKWW